MSVSESYLSVTPQMDYSTMQNLLSALVGVSFLTLSAVTVKWKFKSSRSKNITVFSGFAIVAVLALGVITCTFHQRAQVNNQIASIEHNIQQKYGIPVKLEILLTSDLETIDHPRTYILNFSDGMSGPFLIHVDKATGEPIVSSDRLTESQKFIARTNQ